MLIESRRDGDQNAFVDSDRFALAAMICEIMAWEVADMDSLRRSEMLDSNTIVSRDLRRINKEFGRRWPIGFDLLDTAVKAQTSAEMPGPIDWMRALALRIPQDVFAVAVKPFVGRPVITVSHVHGTEVASTRRVVLQNPNGTFAPLDKRLAEVCFSAPNGSLELEFRWNLPVFVRREGRLVESKGPVSFKIQPGDEVHSNQWRWEVSDSKT